MQLIDARAQQMYEFNKAWAESFGPVGNCLTIRIDVCLDVENLDAETYSNYRIAMRKILEFDNGMISSNALIINEVLVERIALYNRNRKSKVQIADIWLNLTRLLRKL